MSATAANPPQASSTSSKRTKTNSGAHSQQPPHLELSIHTSRVGLYPQPPADITSDTLAHSTITSASPHPTPTGYTRLLSGSLYDFLLYSGREQSRWLIDIAHDICDPASKRGSLQVWDVGGQTWRDVNPIEPLIASIYLYNVQHVVSLSKISQRTGKSKTSTTGYASTMANRVKQRDGQCWVTGISFPLTNSHICPKRMGDHMLRIIYLTFVSTPPTDLSIYNEICGITLSPTLDVFFDTYDLGLRPVAPGQYECHFFLPAEAPRRHTILGSGSHLPASIPSIHGHRAGPPQPQHARNPPPGLIRWHYLQCVLRKFAHSDYRSLQNIYYCELPLPMKGDSDDEGTDDEFNWPSAVLDHGRAAQVAIKNNEQRQRRVEGWVAAVQ